MHILLAVHRFPPVGQGGTELYTLRLAQDLVRRGHQVAVLTYAPGQSREIVPQEEKVDGIPVCRLSFSLDAAAPTPTSNPVQEEYDNQRVAAFLRERFRQQRPDLLHATHLGYLSTSLLAVAHELDIPTVVTLTDFWAICPAGLLTRSDGDLCAGPDSLGACMRCYVHMGPRGRRYATISRWIPDALWRAGATLAGDIGPGRWVRAAQNRASVIRDRLLQADALLCPGRFQRDMLIRNGYPAERLHHAPHGIAHPNRLRRKTPVAEGPTLRLGYIGPLAPHKGAHLPLEAWAKLEKPSDITLAYWGAPPDAQEQKGYAPALLARLRKAPGITHRGPYPNEAIREVLDEMDILIMPSLCYENTPTVIYEALASGTPVLASDQGGMRELVQEYQGGWLFPRGNAAALAAWIRRLATDRTEVQRVAQNIQPIPDFADHAAQIAALYAQLVDRRDR